MKYIKLYLFIVLNFVIINLLSLNGIETAFSQPSYKIHIQNIQEVGPIQKNWYGRPLFVNYQIKWALFKIDKNNQPIRMDTKAIASYHVFLSQGDSTFTAESIRDTVVRGNTVIFRDMKVGPRYYFRIDGINKKTGIVASSDTAWIVTGKSQYLASIVQEEGKKGRDFPIPLFWPFTQILSWFGYHNEVYDHSTTIGKSAFFFIGWFGIFGIFYILPFRCLPNLKLSPIFPFQKVNIFGTNFHLFNMERNYESRISPRFRFIIEAWKRIMLRTNLLVRNGGARKMEDVAQKCFDDWGENGVHAVESLEELIAYNANNKGVDPEKLERKIKKYFGNKKPFGDLIQKPIEIETNYGTTTLDWETVKKDIFNPEAKPLSSYPTVKILYAGLENHLINGFQWQKASSEVDRAIENRASSELESLKRKSLMDWLWNLGALAPLLGLLGTVTGITAAFKDIKNMPSNISHLELVRQLSNGIFEALWTTIGGLVIGILLMLIYYYYKNKLDWIYSRWESIYVHVSEKL